MHHTTEGDEIPIRSPSCSIVPRVVAAKISHVEQFDKMKRAKARTRWREEFDLPAKKRIPLPGV
jgi:hypothetical protein